MARPGDLILVVMLAPQALGSYFDRKRWPLHITLVPWFSAASEVRSQLREGLRQLGFSLPPVSVEAGQTTQLGYRQTTPVTVFTNPKELQPLHQALVDLLRLLQAPVYDTSHLGAQFLPHVTRYDYGVLNQGEHLRVTDFYLVELQPDNSCQIVGKFDLKGAPADA